MSAFMWKPLVVMAVAMLMACAPATANAAFGDLDASFGVGGKKRLDKRQSGRPHIRVQADGGILRSAASSPSGLPGLTRINPGGSTDATFGSGGYLPNPTDHSVLDLELLADQRIAALYQRWAGTESSRILRVYSARGELEWTFDFASLPRAFLPASIAVQGSSILVSGGLSQTTVGIVRIDGSGTFDSSFAGTGFVTVDGFASGGAGLSALAVGSNMSILLGLDRESGGNSSGTGPSIARFDANGVLDTSFGSGGRSIIHRTTSTLGVSKIAVSQSGNIAATYRFGFPGSRGSYAMWENVNFLTGAGTGLLAASRNSLKTSSIPQASSLIDVVAIPGSGFATVGFDRISVITETRSPDRRFDLNGLTTVSIGPYNSWWSVDVGPDGKLVAAGIYCKTSRPTDTSCRGAMTRLLGFSGGVAAPQPRLATQLGSVYWLGKRRATKLHKIEGVANPAGDLKNVGVAIRRIDGRQLARNRCRWVTRGGLATRLVRRRSSGCSRPVFMRAALGPSGDWAFTFKRRLPVGSYQLYIRATKSDGTHNPLNDDSDSFAAFKVKKHRRR